MIDIPTTITTAAQTYTPPSGSIVLPSKTYFGQRGEYEPVPLVQYDDTLPIIAAALYLNGQPYTVPDGAAINIRMAKGDGTYVYNPALGVSEDRQTAYIAVTYQMTVIAGNYCPILELVVSGDVAGTSELPLQIAENPVPEDAIASTDEYKTIQQLAAQVASAAQIITDNLTGIQYVQENAANISAVAQNGANVTAVGQSISDVNAVGKNIADVQTAAENLQAIQQAPIAADNAAKSARQAQQYAESITPANFVQTSGLLDLIYPVGSIYMSANNVSPQTFLGGSWERIQGRFLLAASSSYTAGSTGGEATHTLTESEIAAHVHDDILAGGQRLSRGNGSYESSTGSSGYGPWWGGGFSAAYYAKTSAAGGGQAHNNMPPYLAVYMWKRTA